MKPPPILRIVNISKRYGRDKTALHKVNLEVERGEILCLLGPSGSGKSTLLRIIAGLEQPSSGSILKDGNDQQGTPARERDVGFVFQTTEAVFPHLTVFANIAFPLTLKIRPREKDDIGRQVNEMLGLVRLAPYAAEYPENLSGGEQQRVAIARALVYRPSLLLLDEPLSSLDNILKRELMDIILEIHSKLQPTIIYVTHDEREALELADRLAILNEGQILQVGTPTDMLPQPNSRKVAEILGGWNVIKVKCQVTSSDLNLTLGGQTVSLQHVQQLPVSDDLIEVAIGVPISEVEIYPTGPPATDHDHLSLGGIIERITPWYGKYIVHVLCGAYSWRVESKTLPNWIEPNVGAVIKFSKAAVRVWPYM